MTEKKVKLIFGKRGSGKSYLANKLIAAEKRLFIWDRMGEYNQGIVFTAEEKPVFQKFFQHVYRKDFRIIYRPLHPKEEIIWISDLVYTLGNVTFLVEEIDSICTPWIIEENFEAILNRGRHKNITMIGVTPAPFGIHRDLTRQAKEIYVFSTNEPRDREYLKNLLGSEIEDKLNGLGLYEYVLWQDVPAGQNQISVGKA
jgi:hypothetical protein